MCFKDFYKNPEMSNKTAFMITAVGTNLQDPHETQESYLGINCCCCYFFFLAEVQMFRVSNQSMSQSMSQKIRKSSCSWINCEWKERWIICKQWRRKESVLEGFGNKAPIAVVHDVNLQPFNLKSNNYMQQTCVLLSRSLSRTRRTRRVSWRLLSLPNPITLPLITSVFSMPADATNTDHCASSASAFLSSKQFIQN